jgi:predicted nuclease of predicted toxin-antitoxin system
MRFLADMGISPLTVLSLRAEGHDAIRLREEGLERLPDHLVLEKAQQERRILLTADLDFGYLMASGGHFLPSVVLFRLFDMAPASVTRRLEALLRAHSEDLERGAFAVITELATRVRHLPIGQDGDETPQ